MICSSKNSLYTIDEIKRLSKTIFTNSDFVEKAFLFGSYARNEQNEKSDIDFMIITNRKVGLEFFGLYEFLGKTFNKKVDVITQEEALRIMPKTIERDKVLIYERNNENKI